MDLQQVTSRDSILWSIMFGVGGAIVIGAGLIDNPVDYGMSPIFFKWFKLVAAVIALLGAKNGWSWTSLTPKA